MRASPCSRAAQLDELVRRLEVQLVPGRQPLGQRLPAGGHFVDDKLGVAAHVIQIQSHLRDKCREPHTDQRNHHRAQHSNESSE